MEHPSKKNPHTIRQMFGSLADRYDLMNNIITLGRVGAWRKRMFQAAELCGNESVLDVGTGTGAIARKHARARPGLDVIGCDFSRRMLKKAKESHGGRAVKWCLADALSLPFSDESFDRVVSGYLVRNVSDLSLTFLEQARVLKRGGVLLCLETTPPPRSLFRPLVIFYMRCVLPLLGRMVAGSRGSYSYLAESTQGFKTAQALCEIIEAAGIQVARVDRFMLGTQVLIMARK